MEESSVRAGGQQASGRCQILLKFISSISLTGRKPAAIYSLISVLKTEVAGKTAQDQDRIQETSSYWGQLTVKQIYYETDGEWKQTAPLFRREKYNMNYLSRWKGSNRSWRRRSKGYKKLPNKSTSRNNIDSKNKTVTVGDNNNRVRTNGSKLKVNSLQGNFLVTPMLQCEHKPSGLCVVY